MNIWAQRYIMSDHNRDAQWTIWYKTKGEADEVRRGFLSQVRTPSSPRLVGPVVKHSIAITASGVTEALNRFARDYVPTEEKGRP